MSRGLRGGRDLPSLPMGLDGVDPVVRACLTWGVTPPEAGPATRLTDADWRRSTSLVALARLSPVAASMLEVLDPGGELDDVRRVLHDDALALTAETMTVERGAGPALRALAEAGCTPLVVKGPAAARFAAGPDHRPYRDIDLLVPRHRFRPALAVLQELGYGRPPAADQPWPWFDWVCIEGVNLYRDRYHAVDVHHRIAPWVLTGRLDADTLLARSEAGQVAGVAVRVPSAADSLVIAALHVVNDLWKGDASFLTWRDIAVIGHGLGAVGRRQAFEAAGLGWLATVVESALAGLVEDRPSPVAPARTRREGRERRRLRRLGWGADTFAARHPIGWAVRLPPGRAAAFVAGHAVPSPAYARGKHGGYGRYWLASLRSFGRAAAGADFRREPVAPGRRADVTP